MHKVNYTPESEENLVEIFSYISDDNLFYAAKVINCIKNTIDILKLFPFSWKDIWKWNKMIVESTYKYKIVYTTRASTIYVISIFKA